MIWQFEDKKYGLKNIKEVKNDKEVMGWCEEVVALYKRVEKGEEVSQDEFYKLYLKIDEAGARAWARAREKYDEYINVMADKFIELVEEAPVKK